MSETREALAPCPFCGGTAQTEHLEGKLGRWRWSVGCNDHKPEADDGGEPVAECYGFQSMTSFATKAEAIAAWNRRALSARDERAEERERAALIVERWSLPTIQTPSMWLIDKAGIAAAIRAGGTDG